MIDSHKGRNQRTRALLFVRVQWEEKVLRLLLSYVFIYQPLASHMKMGATLTVSI